MPQRIPLRRLYILVNRRGIKFRQPVAVLTKRMDRLMAIN